MSGWENQVFFLRKNIDRKSFQGVHPSEISKGFHVFGVPASA
jgi:hypothetical protein